jgi:hypothetical protein
VSNCTFACLPFLQLEPKNHPRFVIKAQNKIIKKQASTDLLFWKTVRLALFSFMGIFTPLFLSEI